MLSLNESRIIRAQIVNPDPEIQPVISSKQTAITQWSREAMKLTGNKITPQTVVGYPRMREILPQFYQFITYGGLAQPVIVSHNFKR
jgi:hypothetical protein